MIRINPQTILLQTTDFYDYAQKTVCFIWKINPPTSIVALALPQISIREVILTQATSNLFEYENITDLEHNLFNATIHFASLRLL